MCNKKINNLLGELTDSYVYLFLSSTSFNHKKLRVTGIFSSVEDVNAHLEEHDNEGHLVALNNDSLHATAFSNDKGKFAEQIFSRELILSSFGLLSSFYKDEKRKTLPITLIYSTLDEAQAFCKKQKEEHAIFCVLGDDEVFITANVNDLREVAGLNNTPKLNREELELLASSCVGAREFYDLQDNLDSADECELIGVIAKSKLFKQ